MEIRSIPSIVEIRHWPKIRKAVLIYMYLLPSLASLRLQKHSCNILLFVQQPPVGQSLLIHEISRSHTMTHHIRQVSPFTSDPPDTETPTWQHTTDNHAPGGIRTHNPSRRAAAELRLRQCSHWHQLHVVNLFFLYISFITDYKYT